jgi:diacylglycerol kinase family enzyme
MPTPRAPIGPRLAAALALVALAGVFAFILAYVVQNPLSAIGALVCFGVGVAAAWTAATRQRFRVPRGVAAVALAIAGFVLLLVGDHGAAYFMTILILTVLAAGAGALALRWEVRETIARRWHPVPAARHGVLLMNPRSGGGKVERFDLVAEAKQRGIEPVVLEPGDDLAQLAHRAVAGGADVIGMAGGDGSQAIVAGVAAEHGVGFVCVPAGTRNHLALDLGVDRNDVVGSLDGYGDAVETIMDLATVNGRVFVNNVSLGVYAHIVASEDYRNAKLQTASKMLPELLGPDAPATGLRLASVDGEDVDDPQIVMVSNNPYRLDRLAGFGTRAHLDEGVLGVAALRVDRPADTARLVAAEAAGRVDRLSGWRSWRVPTLEIAAPGPVAAGVDGESETLDPPLLFETRPGVLRARISPRHPGVSPAARLPGLGRASFLGLSRIARGRPSGLAA